MSNKTTLADRIIKRVPAAARLPIPKLRFFWAIARFALGSSALSQLGWFKSAWLEKPVDALGQPIPWMCYPIINFLEERLHPEMRVFEYGCGNSTLWFAKLVRTIISVEHDESWFGDFHSTAPNNSKVILRRLTEPYTNAILEQNEPFDLVVIDGRERVMCSTVCLQRMKDSSVIIWDNSDREKYQLGIAELKKSNFKQLRFRGLTPQSNKVSETSIFYKPENCLGI